MAINNQQPPQLPQLPPQNIPQLPQPVNHDNQTVNIENEQYGQLEEFMTALQNGDHYPNLQNLFINLIDLSDEQTAVLFNALDNNVFPALTHVVLNHNSIEGFPMGGAWLEGLGNNNLLRILDLEGNSIGNEGVVAIVNNLPNNHTLEEINFGSNGVGDPGLGVLAAIINTTNLRNLSLAGDEDDLDEDKITDAGVVVLVDVLRENNRLEWLNLSNNNITNDGAGALLELLNDNQTLRRIILDGNEAINQNLINQIRGLLAQRFPLLHNENEELESEIDSEESDVESYQESEEAELEEIKVELEELEKVTNQNGKRTQDNQPSENEDDDREFKKQKILETEKEVDPTTIPPASIQEPSGENLVELSKPKSPMHK